MILAHSQRSTGPEKSSTLKSHSKGSPKERSWRKARPLSVVVRTKTEQQSERLTEEDQGGMFEGKDRGGPAAAKAGAQFQ